MPPPPLPGPGLARPVFTGPRYSVASRAMPLKATCLGRHVCVCAVHMIVVRGRGHVCMEEWSVVLPGLLGLALLSKKLLNEFESWAVWQEDFSVREALANKQTTASGKVAHTGIS